MMFLFPSISIMASVVRACDLEDSKLRAILADCLGDFPEVKALRKEQETCIVNLAHGNDVFPILPTGFGKSLIFSHESC